MNFWIADDRWLFIHKGPLTIFGTTLNQFIGSLNLDKTRMLIMAVLSEN